MARLLALQLLLCTLVSPARADTLEGAGDAIRASADGSGGSRRGETSRPSPKASDVEVDVGGFLSRCAPRQAERSASGNYLDPVCAARSERRQRRALERQEREELAESHPELREPVFELAIEGGVYAGNVYASTLDMTAWRERQIGLRVRQSFLFESDAEVVQSAVAGSAHLTAFTLRRRRGMTMFGLGVRNWFDLRGTEWGFDALLAGDVRIRQRGHANLAIQMGSAGHAFVLENRATIGFVRRHYEMYCGYSHTLYVPSGDSEVDRVGIGGGVAGLRLSR